MLAVNPSGGYGLELGNGSIDGLEMNAGEIYFAVAFLPPVIYIAGNFSEKSKEPQVCACIGFIFGNGAMLMAGVFGWISAFK